MSGKPTVLDRPRMVEILEVVDESQTVRSFIYRDHLCCQAKPGQFVMVWIPGVDEIPMSISIIKDNNIAGFTVRKVGIASEALFEMKVGSTIGIRGPYGTHFDSISGRVMIVGAGTGIAPLMPLSETLVRKKSTVFLIIGGKTIDEFVLVEKATKMLSKTNSKIIITTEDGSYGTKGLATDAMEPILMNYQIDMIYTCGPELMIKKVFEIAEKYNVNIQASLERIMKCSIGICGSCGLGRYLVCKDGPIFNSDQIREILDELGEFKREHSGKIIKI